VFVTLTDQHKAHYIVIPTRELRRRIPKGTGKTWHIYMAALKGGFCLNTRSLTMEQKKVAYITRKIKRSLDFSEYFENWKLLDKASR